MTTKTVHVISHSHWDREWYLPFESHRYRLIELIDLLIDSFERNSDFKSFHLDGQTILLEDYLQIRPDRRETLERLIRENKLIVGPWYILQDEFLTSGEANVRNLLIGHADVESFGGKVCKIGYFPDSFGNMGQAPQLLLQAGIDNAVFGRGVKPTGADNAVLDSDKFESPYSEMIWQAPDGSRVLGILFANWYHNGMEIPVEAEAAREYWNMRMAKVEKYAATNQLLFMNGCDHQPLQRELPEALATARALHPGVDFVHSNFVDYVASVKKALPEGLSTITGELRSQRTDGWGTLVNTASARVYIKQANQRCQTLLEKAAEPLSVFAARTGKAYPRHTLRYAWKTLMQNHPHDSICGCSVDEVHREMMVRFAKAEQVANEVRTASAQWVADLVDTSAFAGIDSAAVPFVVFNTSGWPRGGTVTVELELAKADMKHWRESNTQSQTEAASMIVKDGYVVDAVGNRLQAMVEDLGGVFGYKLPKDRFRAPYYARKVRVTFQAGPIPAMGYRAYAWVNGERLPAACENPVVQEGGQSSDSVMENDFLKVRIEADGTLTVSDKRSGRIYSGLCAYEDVGDIGNEYIFRQPDGDQAITTRGTKAVIRLIESSGIRTVYEVVHRMRLPESANDLLKEEIRNMVDIRDRKAVRSQANWRTVAIKTTLCLEKDSPVIRVRGELDNTCMDHRLRVLIPTDTRSAMHTADSVFELAKRENEPAPEWINPSNCQHMQAFVNCRDDLVGLTVANKGLNEYEVLRDDRNTIAVTLLRSVAELGDWGVFPTPDAQCLGEQSFEFAILPHADRSSMLESFQLAYQWQVPFTIMQTDIHKGDLPVQQAFLEWQGSEAALSCFKIAEVGEDEIVRWFNMTDQPAQLRIKTHPDETVYTSTIMETRQSNADPSQKPGADNSLVLDLKPCEILTIGIKRE